MSLKSSLTALARGQLDLARQASSGRSPSSAELAWENEGGYLGSGVHDEVADIDPSAPVTTAVRADAAPRTDPR